MRQGPIETENGLACTGCEHSNRKMVSNVRINNKAHSGTVYHCIHPQGHHNEIWIKDKTPDWCPLE